jgi:hypothetical protein
LLDHAVMKTFRALALGLLLATPLPALADDSPSKPAPAEAAAVRDARLVPVLREGAFVGLKVYAIRPGGRFDQPQSPFHNGDTIEEIDHVPVTSDTGTTALHDKVIVGKADAVVTVRRAGKVVMLTSKAVGDDRSRR